MREEKIIVLDYLSNGYPGMRKIEPIVQAIGFNYFNLLELVADDKIKIKEKDVLRLDDSEKIKYIRRKLFEKDLTNFARGHLEEVIKIIINSREKDFVDLFNNATKISIRMHKLELLPSIGKKHIQLILKERKKPFTSFDDIKKRIGITGEINRIIARRVIEELKGDQKYYLFVPHLPDTNRKSF
ncbi:MAG: DUF655 domain-containing protein [Candidatus Aenigmarchaeota archaeon]|nr:DUF655 domain-containing protein [Candidatus Aenigmarchaeota archaeon]